MTRDEMVEKAWSFWELQNQRRLDDAFALLHPDGGYASICMETWEPMPFATGWLRTFLEVILEQSTLRYHRGEAMAEGDTVVWQFTGTFRLPGDPQEHDQSYCMVMTFRDGLIFQVREFLDTRKEEPLIAFVLETIAAREAAVAASQPASGLHA